MVAREDHGDRAEPFGCDHRRAVAQPLPVIRCPRRSMRVEAAPSVRRPTDGRSSRCGKSDSQVHDVDGSSIAASLTLSPGTTPPDEGDNGVPDRVERDSCDEPGQRTEEDPLVDDGRDESDDDAEQAQQTEYHHSSLLRTPRSPPMRRLSENHPQVLYQCRRLKEALPDLYRGRSSLRSPAVNLTSPHHGLAVLIGMSVVTHPHPR